MSKLTAVQAAIAHAVMGDDEPVAARLGTIDLRPHQRDAVRRLRAAMADFGGALLADEPGLGKTYVALALAREAASTIVVAPAALRTMWHEAAARADVPIAFVSHEALSRRAPLVRAALVIVDEAHHASTVRTRRYGHLAGLVAGARTLLISATPVRNRRAELDALLALFLGPRAATLREDERARCMVRREAGSALRPAVDGPHWHRLPRTLDLSGELAKLPPALPALDGRDANALVAMTLARCWASSLAALDVALRRRLQRGAALEAILDAGRLPTRAELRAWVLGDDAVQLALPFLAATITPNGEQLRSTLLAHVRAVAELRARLSPEVERDMQRRAGFLRRLRARHPLECIIAFTSFAVTAERLYRLLARKPGVALLTVRGARTASGVRPRADILAALGPGGPRVARPRIDEMALVITTDVLSEGVNLQRASVVVHLDLPWTPAGLEQRVGRAARIGSVHRRVAVHGIAPPRSAERMLGLDRRLASKRTAAVEAGRAASEMERVQEIVALWRTVRGAACGVSCGVGRAEELPVVAAAMGARRRRFLAVVEGGGGARVVAGFWSRAKWRVSDAPRDLLAVVAVAAGEEAECAGELQATALSAVHAWLRTENARAASGVRQVASRGRTEVLARVDDVLRQAAPHNRPMVASRAAALRGLIDAATGAGAERLFGELARTASRQEAPSEWLAACERSLTSIARTRAGHDGTVAVRALLLLLPG